MNGQSKEYLYGEVIKAKLITNEFREENKKLKTRMRVLESKLDGQYKQTEFYLKTNSSGKNA